MNQHTPTPICEECDIPMHRYGGQEGDRYVEGWGCDGCGWSEDDEEYQAEYRENPKDKERKYLFDAWKRLGIEVTNMGNIVQNEMPYSAFKLDYFEWKRGIERTKERITALERATVQYFEEGNLT